MTHSAPRPAGQQGANLRLAPKPAPYPSDVLCGLVKRSLPPAHAPNGIGRFDLQRKLAGWSSQTVHDALRHLASKGDAVVTVKMWNGIPRHLYRRAAPKAAEAAHRRNADVIPDAKGLP